MSLAASPRPSLAHEAGPRARKAAPLYVWLLSAGVALQFSAGHAGSFGFPVPPDRVLIPLALLLWLRSRPWQQWEFRVVPVHLVMLAALMWCLGSMYWAGTYRNSGTLFAYIDSFGVQPWILAVVGPAVFCTRQRVMVLLWWLTGVGAYLALMAILEGLHLNQLLFPRYLYAPTHTHWGRAIGPSLQVASNGLALLGCGVAAAVVFVLVRDARRWIGLTVAVGCALGVFFTLTRSLWIGATVGAVVALLAEPRLRRRVILGVAALGLTAVMAVITIPALNEAVQARLGDDRSAHDRINAMNAGFRVLESRPVTGVGFQNFPAVENDWLWQEDQMPITETSIAVHNVILGHAVELGIVGAALWVAVLGFMMSAALVGGSRIPAPRPVRLGVLAYVTGWLIVSMFVPISYALPCSIFWLGLGIIARPEDLGWFRKETQP